MKAVCDESRDTTIQEEETMEEEEEEKPRKAGNF